MTHSIEAIYEDAKLRLTFTEQHEASLYINGVERDMAKSSSPARVLKLGSPVQTGYEHHEYIEAVVQYQTDRIKAVLTTGGEKLAELEVSV